MCCCCCCCFCFVFGQIGDVKTAERYFEDVEKACQMTGSQPSHTTCVLMNRYPCVVHLAPAYSVCLLYAAQDHFALHGSGTSFRAYSRFVIAGSCFLLACQHRSHLRGSGLMKLWGNLQMTTYPTPTGWDRLSLLPADYIVMQSCVFITLSFLI